MLNYLCNKLRCMIYELSRLAYDKQCYGLDSSREVAMLNKTKSYLWLIENPVEEKEQDIPYGNIRAWIYDFDPNINLKTCGTCTIVVTQIGVISEDCPSITITQL